MHSTPRLKQVCTIGTAQATWSTAASISLLLWGQLRVLLATPGKVLGSMRCWLSLLSKTRGCRAQGCLLISSLGGAECVL